MNNLKRYFLTYALLIAAICVALTSEAQNSKRILQSYYKDNNQLIVVTNEGNYAIQFYDSNIVETSFIPKGEVCQQASTAVVMIPEKGIGKLVEKDSLLVFQSPGLAVLISKKPFGISYEYKNKRLIAEKNGYVKTDSTENIDFNIEKNEVLYGGGVRVLGMNRRGYRLKLYNRAHYGYGTHSELMNYSMPLVISSKKYAMHFDNAPIGYLDLDSKHNNTLRYETISGRKTYQIIASDTWNEFSNQFTKLTGRQPMIPRWALGNFASRFGYHSQKQVLKTIDEYRKDSIPVDAIIMDLYWFGKNLKGDMGNLAFYRDSFPNPEKMISELNQEGVKSILITEPFILTTSKRWDEVKNENILGVDTLGNPYTFDFYFGHTGLIDVFKPKAISWFWNIYKNLVNKGVGGWWGDLGEPEVHPSALQHVNGSADEVHNIYGHYWAKLVFDGYRKDFPKQRPFILMRAGAVGSQRYGMIPWSGDVSRSWDGLKPQTEISLQMGMQGIAYMHSDLGGFAGDNLDDELYTRWLQYGVFQPIFRPHAQESVPSEPVFREAHTKALAKKSIELRYQLMPYNYTLVFENHKSGIPLMRPLFYEEAANKDLLALADTYLWGDAFLVSTITDPGLKQKQVYMPKSNVWFDFATDKRFEGGKTYSIPTAEDHIPVFVRGGAFIPMIKGMQNSRDYSLKNFELHFYQDKTVAESEGQLYDDDGSTPEAYEKGQYELLKFHSIHHENILILSLNSKSGKDYQTSDKTIQMYIHHISKKPKKVFMDKKSIAFDWDETTRELHFQGVLKSDNNLMFKIKLAK